MEEWGDGEDLLRPGDRGITTGPTTPRYYLKAADGRDNLVLL
jgi:hypothetical protein